MLLNTVAVAIVALGPVAFASPAPGVTDIDWSLLGGDTLSPLSGANPFKRQLYCTISTHVPCPNIDRCSPPGYTCCPNGVFTCRPPSVCLDTIPGSFKPTPPLGFTEIDVSCCPPGSNCTDPNWFDALLNRGSTTRTTTSTSTGAATTSTRAVAPLITLGTQRTVSIDLKRDVVYTGAWYAYAWAYAWCSVWGPSGQRVDASASASVATVQFGSDVKAVAVSMSTSANSRSSYTFGGLAWDEAMTANANASASINPDGSISASASAACTWTRKFTLGYDMNSNDLRINVNRVANPDPDSWCQINAIRGYASEEDMNADIAPGEGKDDSDTGGGGSNDTTTGGGGGSNDTSGGNDPGFGAGGANSSFPTTGIVANHVMKMAGPPLLIGIVCGFMAAAAH